MVEVGVLFQCPKCKRFQNRIFRFKNTQDPTTKDLVQRKRKARYECKYCRHVSKFQDLPQQKSIDTQQSKASGFLNADKFTNDEEFVEYRIRK